MSTTLTPVLPAIPTTGLTADDVPRLTETTRDAMLAALKELSPPAAKLPEAAQSSGKSTAVEGNQLDSLRQRPLAESAETSTASLVDTLSRGESTEDEMDDDAVLLKHPKAA